MVWQWPQTLGHVQKVSHVWCLQVHATHLAWGEIWCLMLLSLDAWFPNMLWRRGMWRIGIVRIPTAPMWGMHMHTTGCCGWSHACCSSFLWMSQGQPAYAWPVWKVPWACRFWDSSHQPSNAHGTFLYTTERLHSMLQLLWWSSDWLKMGIAVVHRDCVKQPIQKAIQLVFTVLQAVEECAFGLHHCLIPAIQEACHLMRKAKEEISQLRAIPKPLAQSNRVRCLWLPWWLFLICFIVKSTLWACVPEAQQSLRGLPVLLLVSYRWVWQDLIGS